MKQFCLFLLIGFVDIFINAAVVNVADGTPIVSREIAKRAEEMRNFMDVARVSKEKNPEPFPLVSVDITGVPVFKGYSSGSLNDLKPDIIALFNYSRNENFVNSLKERAFLKDQEAALNLFVIGDRVSPPSIRDRLFKRIGELFISKDLDLNSLDGNLAYYLCKYCFLEIKKCGNDNLYERLLLKASNSNDAAFKILFEYYLSRKDVKNLNKLILETRRHSQSNDRLFYLDNIELAFQKNQKKLEAVNWQSESPEVFIARLEKGRAEESNYILSWLPFFSTNKTEGKILLETIGTTKWVPETYSQLLDFCKEDDENRAFWGYMLVRENFSVRGFDALINYFSTQKNYIEIFSILKFVKIKLERNELSYFIDDEEKAAIDFWIGFQTELWSDLQTPNINEQVEKRVQALLENAYYENNVFEKKIQNKLKIQ